MATITPTQAGQGSTVTVAQTLGTADDFNFKPGSRQLLSFENNTGGAVIITLLGDEATTANCVGTAQTIDLSVGYQFTINNTETAIVAPETVKLYLSDSVNKPAINSDLAGVDIFLFEL